MQDEILLRGMVFFGRHGANPEETALGQRFGADLSVWLDVDQAARSDDLDDTVSYSALYKLVRAEIEGEPSKLLEHLAGRILHKVLASDPRIQIARVTVIKLNPPLKGSTTGEAAVTLERDRSWLQSQR
jgi:dihydroneopterin aldolase